MKKSKLVEKFTKGWNHFCNHINFADSNLDAESIQFMNEMPGRICTSHDELVKALRPFAKLADLIPAPDALVGQWVKFNSKLSHLQLDYFKDAKQALAKSS